MTEEEQDPFAKSRMTLGEHLDELRSRLLKGAVAVLVAFVACWSYRDLVTRWMFVPYHQAMDMLEEHYVGEAKGLLAGDPERERTEFFVSADPADERLLHFDRRAQGIKVGEHFFFMLKVCLYFAVAFGAPILLWQLWGFVAAGLYDRERLSVLKYFPTSLVLFGVGVLFGFFFLVPYGMYFLNQEAPLDLVDVKISLEMFFTFMSSLCFAMGFVFQLPLIMSFLAATDIVRPKDMARFRGHFIVLAFVIAAILTPPDPVTQCMMGVPMVLLYEIGIWTARWSARKTKAVAST